jgi:hypothetical protein
MSNKERVEQSDQVLLSLLVVRSLNVDEELNSAASLLKDAIDQEQSVSDKVLITIHSLDNLKEQSDVVFSFPFLKIIFRVKMNLLQRKT